MEEAKKEEYSKENFVQWLKSSTTGDFFTNGPNGSLWVKVTHGFVMTSYGKFGDSCASVLIPSAEIK